MGKPINRLPLMTDVEVATDDLIPIQDVSKPKTRGITIAELIKRFFRDGSVKTKSIDWTDRQVAFRARRNTNWTSPTNNQTTNFNFDKINYNFGNGYNATTGLFTAPYDGVYSFTWGFFTESTATGRVFVIPRGTAFTGSSPAGDETASRYSDLIMNQHNRQNSSAEFYMTAGQTFGLDVWTSAANQLNHVDTWFAGHMVFPATKPS